MTLQLFQLGADPQVPFPPPQLALAEPDGLLAIGGDLSPARFVSAYRCGIFPWFSEGEPILWWSPSRRAVLPTDPGIRFPSKLRRRLRQSRWTVRADTAFDDVVAGCAAPRGGREGTWITGDMRSAYCALHALGHAHSIEVFDAEGTLVGGVLGLEVGHLFCGDSMFSRAPGASTLALCTLARRLHAWGWPLIDAQVPNPHTSSLGVQVWPRAAYLDAIATLTALPGHGHAFGAAFRTWPAADVVG